MHVRIYHNVARDQHGRKINFFGYKAEQPLVLVFAAAFDGIANPVWVAEDIFWACNADIDELGCEWRQFVRAYRNRGLRSLSIGDVVVIDYGDDFVTAAAIETSGIGWADAASLNITVHSEPGTAPWPVDTRPVQAGPIRGKE